VGQQSVALTLNSRPQFLDFLQHGASNWKSLNNVRFFVALTWQPWVPNWYSMST